MSYDVEMLKEFLTYRDGKLFWKKSNSNRRAIGEEAGWVSDSGYRLVSLNNKTYRAHRVVWLFHGNALDSDQDIDHINRDRLDNRVENLRVATRSQNRMNEGIRSINTSGVKGASWNKLHKKWEGYIQKDGKKVHLGLFDCIERAKQAIQTAREELHEGYACHG